MNANEKIAWLAGFWDGEGSIGIMAQKMARKTERPIYLSAIAQLSNTSQEAVEFCLSVLGEIGISKFGYTYQERDPSKQKDAHYIRVTRLADLRKMTIAVLPYAVLKREMWEVMRDYLNSRLEGVVLLKDGTMPRGGKLPPRPFSTFEIDCAKKLWLLNNRGPDMQARYEQWTMKLQPLSNP